MRGFVRHIIMWASISYGGMDFLQTKHLKSKYKKNIHLFDALKKLVVSEKRIEIFTSQSEHIGHSAGPVRLVVVRAQVRVKIIDVVAIVGRVDAECAGQIEESKRV